MIKKRVNGEVVLVPAHAGSQDGTQSDAEDEGEGEVAIRAINDEAVDEAADAQADDESAAAGAYPETQMPGMSRQRVGGEDVFIPDHQDDSSDDDNGETPSQAPGAAGDGPEAAAVGRTASAAQTQAETAAIVTTDEVIEELATAAVQVLVEETLPLATQSADEAATATATAIATSPPALVHAAAQTTEVEVEVQAQAPARAKVAQQGVQVQQGELLEREPGVGQEEPPSVS